MIARLRSWSLRRRPWDWPRRRRWYQNPHLEWSLIANSLLLLVLLLALTFDALSMNIVD